MVVVVVVVVVEVGGGVVVAAPVTVNCTLAVAVPAVAIMV